MKTVEGKAVKWGPNCNVCVYSIYHKLMLALTINVICTYNLSH
jgi:hypothetical protein